MQWWESVHIDSSVCVQWWGAVHRDSERGCRVSRRVILKVHVAETGKREGLQVALTCSDGVRVRWGRWGVACQEHILLLGMGGSASAGTGIPGDAASGTLFPVLSAGPCSDGDVAPLFQC